MMVRTFILICIFAVTLLPNALTAQDQKKIHPDIEAYIRQHKALAISEMQRTGVPASIKLAQGIIETQAGKSDLVKRSNNHFGIKCKTDWKGDKVYHDDDARGECFRAYQSAEDSYKDHSDFLKNSSRYSSLFLLQPTDYKGWSNGLKKAGYATNPKYPAMLIKAIEDYNLELYTEIALGRKKDPEVLLANTPVGEGVEDLEAQASASTVQNKHAAVNNGANNHRQSNTGLNNNTGSDKTGKAAVSALVAAPKTYPTGIFTINGTKVLYAKAGSSVIALAMQNNIPLAKLLDFNEMTQRNVLEADQLIFLQKKKKLGATDIYIVKPGESLAQIAQEQGMRLETLLEFNGMHRATTPAPGEALYLKKKKEGNIQLAENL